MATDNTARPANSKKEICSKDNQLQTMGYKHSLTIELDSEKHGYGTRGHTTL